MAYGLARDESREEWEDSFFEEQIQGQSYGNLAAAPETWPEQRPEPDHPEPARKPERRRRVRRVPDPARQRSKRAFTAFSIMVLCGAMGIVGMYAQVYGQKQRVSRLEANLEETQKQTAMIQEEAADKVSVTELYTYATEKLGMVAAEGKTIIYITVDPQDYTEDYTPGKPKETRVSFHWFG